MKSLLYLLFLCPLLGNAQEVSLDLKPEISVEKTPLRVYTNPSNSFTRIEFWSDEAQVENIDVITGDGRLFERIVHNVNQEGLQLAELDTRNFSPGVYFIKVNEEMRKVVRY
ncbi:T9SS type A sorting domain-containing protein [Jiulongibacter sp. NS-SX5]|uniref:T9SS type A sorting domain-containing protein n=1 Tax=Jiulongibacter sp. NS-SX5 TaxID=3463854 RepID=UPI004059DE18